MRKAFAAIPMALAIGFCGSAVLAQEIVGFTALSACRIDAEHVLLRASFDGGACQEVETAQLAEPRGTIVSVHLPTIETVEICTMQIVPIAVEQVIEADEDIANLYVTLGDPRNNEIGSGEIEVADNEEDCLAERG